MEESNIKPTVTKEKELNLEVSETYDYVTVWFLEKLCIFIS